MLPVLSLSVLAIAGCDAPPATPAETETGAVFEQRAISDPAEFEAIFVGNGIYVMGTEPAYIVNANGRLDSPSGRYNGVWVFENGQFCETMDAQPDVSSCAMITQFQPNRFLFRYTTGWLSAQPDQIRSVGPASP